MSNHTFIELIGGFAYTLYQTCETPEDWEHILNENSELKTLVLNGHKWITNNSILTLDVDYISTLPFTTK